MGVNLQLIPNVQGGGGNDLFIHPPLNITVYTGNTGIRPCKTRWNSTARSRKWCLRHRAILQTETEEIFQIQVQL